MASAEALLELEDLFCGEKSLLRRISLKRDLDLCRGLAADVAYPLGFSPHGDHGRLARRTIVLLDLQNDAVVFAGAPADVRDDQECMAGNPAEAQPPERLKPTARDGDRPLPRRVHGPWRGAPAT